MAQANTSQYIIFDIDSSSVGALVFERSVNRKTKKSSYRELFSIREYIVHHEKLDFDMFFLKTLSTFSLVAEKLIYYTDGSLEDIFINVSAPWVSSQLRTIHYEKEKDFVVDQQLIDHIVEKELAEPFHHTRDFREHKNLVHIEHRILDIFLNGYKAQKLHNQKVHDIDIRTLVSVMSSQTHRDFLHVVERVFHRGAQFFSNNFMLYHTTLLHFPHERDLVLLDISGELTEFELIIQGEFKKIGTLPTGTHFLKRIMAQKLSVGIEKLESLLRMYKEGFLDDTHHASLEKVMDYAFRQWLKYLYDFFAEIGKEYLIPHTFVVLAPDILHPWFFDRLSDADEIKEHMAHGKDISTLFIQESLQHGRESLISDDSLNFCLSFVEEYFLSQGK